MKSYKILVALAFVIGSLAGTPSVFAAAYEQFVVAEDIVSRQINGEFRFCERVNLQGNICGRLTKIFGKERFLVQDWWSPSTYVEAFAGPSHEVIRIEPTGTGRGVVIYFH